MAVSLLCKDCNTLLRNIKEAQAHNDATGHSNFEESTQPVPQLVCTDCGKVCRNDAEKTLHTRFTGHKEYVDKTGQDLEVLNTEQQMAEAKQEMKDQLEADAELLGLKRKPAKRPATATAEGQPASSTSAAAAAATAEGGEGDGGGGEPMEVDAAEAAGGSSQELVPPQVSPEMLKELEEMGVTPNRAVRALHFSGNSTIEGAINWLTEHEGDADLDEPLLVPQGSSKESLTPEEARLRAAELLRKAKEKREREERELEAVRERERIRHGKELLDAQRKEEETRLKRIAEERMREKNEDARVREALRLKLEEDRRERRRKLGLPEELTEEERAREAEKARQKAEADLKRHVFVKPVSVMQRMRDVLVGMKKAAPGGEEQFKTCINTMLKYVGNIVKAPEEEKFRAIKQGNAAFQSRVAVVPGAQDFLVLCGFQVEGDALVMPRDAVNPEVLNAAGSEISNALSNPFFGAL